MTHIFSHYFRIANFTPSGLKGCAKRGYFRSHFFTQKTAFYAETYSHPQRHTLPAEKNAYRIPSGLKGCAKRGFISSLFYLFCTQNTPLYAEKHRHTLRSTMSVEKMPHRGDMNAFSTPSGLLGCAKRGTSCSHSPAQHASIHAENQSGDTKKEISEETLTHMFGHYFKENGEAKNDCYAPSGLTGCAKRGYIRSHFFTQNASYHMGKHSHPSKNSLPAEYRLLLKHDTLKKACMHDTLKKECKSNRSPLTGIQTPCGNFIPHEDTRVHSCTLA